MENNYVFKNLVAFIKEFHNGKSASGGTEVVKKCHICGDSKDPKSRHMYIGLQRQSGLIVYNCFKCNSSGIVNSTFLRDMDYYHNTVELGIEIDKYNAKILNNPRNIALRYKESNIAYANNYIFNKDMAMRKLEVINKRLDTTLSLEEASNLKIIFNLKDFLYSNNIRELTRNPNIVDILDKYFMGFLSVDNSFITMRRLVPEGKLPEFIDKRYVNYNVFGKIDNSCRHYIIPVNVDTFKPIKIYITEGTFDILSMYLNVVEDKNQCIFSSIGGKSYYMMIKFFLEKFGFINIEFHLCPDNDVTDDYLSDIFYKLKPYNIPLYIHRNISDGEKDFGVCKSRIKEHVYRVI